jgi:GT2 family glycosyltransferase
VGEVLVIIVNHKAADSTAKLLDSAAAMASFSRACVLVVENGSGDGSPQRLRRAVSGFDNVELLESPINRGYFAGANWALRQYLARGQQPDWVIVCNHDIVFEDPDFLVKLLGKDPASIEVIAPAITPYQTGVDCNPFLRRRPTSFQLWRYRFWLSNYYLMWFKQSLSPHVRRLRGWLRFPRERATRTGGMSIYAAHGAFLIFSRSYFARGGYIDDGFFLYAEEFSVAEICLRRGLRIVHDLELRVWHDGHQATGRMCNRAMFEHGRQGLQYALRKYFFSATADLGVRAKEVTTKT